MKTTAKTTGKTSMRKKIGIEILVILLSTGALTLFGFAISPAMGMFFMLIPYAYILYAVNTYYILHFHYEKRINLIEYIILACCLGFIASIPFVLFLLAGAPYWHKEFLFFFILYFTIATSLSYHYYFKNRARNSKVLRLQRDLGQTDAEFKLMQSQVNPHFLFNVMNSIYGLALQENATKTADSVQRLSQMMRFMIFENQQEQILLSRDLSYLNEYIAIQSLRTENVPTVKIESDIVDTLSDLYITPMLLIPFVENAFKHGISMTQPSWIRVNADLVGNQLKFSVYNSIHQAQGIDLERTKSGIGLENVRNRLELTYPDRYMLVIEQNQQEYFVFLTIDLDTGKTQSSTNPQ
ncbi:sensor histidine kinase [Sphingobacterium lactis]|uniref:sensor histidine kinase n=1 Tax=Sphingobacterium lactis TaxID=797291 RepID=UPI003DA611BD